MNENQEKRFSPATNLGSRRKMDKVLDVVAKKLPQNVKHFFLLVVDGGLPGNAHDGSNLSFRLFLKQKLANSSTVGIKLVQFADKGVKQFAIL